MNENDIDFSMDCDQCSPTSATVSSLNENSLINIDDSTGNDLLRTIMNKLDKQDEFNETMLEKLSKSNENHRKLAELNETVLEKLKFIENELKESQKKSVVEPFKKVIQPPIIQKNKHQTMEPLSPNEFVFRSVFKNVSKMKESKLYRNEPEEHFGVLWYPIISRRGEHLGVYLKCEINGADIFDVNATCSLGIVHPKGKGITHFFSPRFSKQSDAKGFSNFMKWEEMEKSFLVDDKIVFEASMKIYGAFRLDNDDLRSFDDSSKDCSDIILNVEAEKFYVSKLYLAAHSSYFKTMFLGLFDESKMSEITLTEINYEHFQKYLEVLYGEPAIDEFTVEGILHLGDMYDTEIVVRKCEEFLLKGSNKTLKKKLQMSVRYNLEKLKEKCLLEIKTIEDIQSVIPGDINDLDKTIMAILLEKSLSFK